MTTIYPRISIVTPSFSQAEFLEEAIQSVLEQGYPNLEYVIIDGGSTDGSVEIIRRYSRHLAYWVSEPDGGHANGLNKGFARTTGEIMGWLNSDDVLYPGALKLLAKLFREYEEIEWLTAQPSYIDPSGRIVAVYPPPRWSRLSFIKRHSYRWIQQESTYWRRSLWERAGGHISEDYKLACDFELWARMFRYAKLYSSYGLIGAFRFNPTQKTRHSMDVYEHEARAIAQKELDSLPAGFLGRRFWRLTTLNESPLPLSYDSQMLGFENPNRRASTMVMRVFRIAWWMARGWAVAGLKKIGVHEHAKRQRDNLLRKYQRFGFGGNSTGESLDSPLVEAFIFARGLDGNTTEEALELLYAIGAPKPRVLCIDPSDRNIQAAYMLAAAGARVTCVEVGHRRVEPRVLGFETPAVALAEWNMTNSQHELANYDVLLIDERSKKDVFDLLQGRLASRTQILVNGHAGGRGRHYGGLGAAST